MENIVLYGTSACHLCEVAEKLLVTVLSGKDYTKSDIAFSQELFERYGEFVPVVKRDDGKELSWPFDSQSLRLFLFSAED